MSDQARHGKNVVQVDEALDNRVVQAGSDVDNAVVRMAARFKAAIESKRDEWKLDAVAAYMREHGCPGVDAPYIHKLYDGERPITNKLIASLPDAIEAVYHAMNAEAFEGQIVVKPAAPGIDAVRSFVSGLLGLQMPHLPAKAGPAAKANLRAGAAASVPRVVGDRR